MIQEVKNNDLSKAMQAKCAVVDFNATWCGPCRMLGPVLEQISEEMAGEVEFYGVDVDENSSLAAQYGVMSVPTVILFKDGKKADMNIGFQPKDMYAAWIRKNL